MLYEVITNRPADPRLFPKKPTFRKRRMRWGSVKRNRPIRTKTRWIRGSIHCWTGLSRCDCLSTCPGDPYGCVITSYSIHYTKLYDDEQDEGFSKQLEREADESQEDLRVSQLRPADQVKPGNLVHMRVKDADRDLSDDADKVISYNFV